MSQAQDGAKVSDVLGNSVQKVLEVVMFENWLRFYFIGQNDETNESSKDKLFLYIPEQGMKRIKELYPHLHLLAENVNTKELSFELSRSAVCEHVLTEVDGITIPKEMSTTVFDSVSFQVELQLFNMWVQAHEAQLDENFLEFGVWKNFYSQWRSSDAIQDIAQKMLTSAHSPSANEGSIQ